MMRSLFSGVSGLKNHQTRMDVIGNNISNVNTTGFKSSRVTFADSLSQTLSAASGANGTTGGTNPKQIGLGSRVSSIDTVFTDGSIQSTGVNTDLCLSGNGLFVVSEGAKTYYTRNGAFKFDGTGNFVNSDGLYVQGWMNESKVDNDVINTNGATTLINVKAGQSMAASATKTATYGYNLDARELVIKSINYSAGTNTKTTNTKGDMVKATSDYPLTITLSDGSTTTVTSGTYTVGHSIPLATTITVYDSLGNDHTVSVLMEKVGEGIGKKTNEKGVTVDDQPVSVWIATLAKNELTADDGSVTTLKLQDDKPVTLLFDSNGAYFINPTDKDVEISGAAIYNCELLTDAATYDASATTENAAAQKCRTVTAASGLTAATLHAKYSNGNTSAEQDVSIKFNGMTQYAGTNTANGTTDGYAAGVLESVSIDETGTIYGTYSNDVIRKEAQVAIAQFSNAAGLTKLGDSLYQASRNSGTPNVKTSTDLGVSITANSLEMSNVDIASEFSDMIITQRGFQSNSKIITVSDELIETLINMKR